MDEVDRQFAKEQAEILRAAKDRIVSTHTELMFQLAEVRIAASRISCACPPAMAHRILMRCETIRRKMSECDFGGLAQAATSSADIAEKS